MNEALLWVYHRLPPFARSAAASLHGLSLRAWRYGPETERLVEEALARERWNADQWRSWQQERLAYILHRAATCVPYYRTQWAERRQNGDRSSWEYLENWPVLEKEIVRGHARSFLAEDCSPRWMFRTRTSGTTGTPLSLWQSRRTLRAWYALFEARWRRWYGVSRRDCWAILGGQLVTPVNRRRPPFWAWNAAFRQLYLSSYHLGTDQVGNYLEALARHRVVYLWGYTSALCTLAHEAARQRRSDLVLKVVMTNAEPLYQHQRAIIETGFRCPVRETYGMSEMVAAAGECEQGSLHLWPEAGVVEVFREDRPLPAGESGDLVCTGLINADMPLIRYRLGDRGSLPASGASCLCGRLLPTLQSIEGRLEDSLTGVDGRQVSLSGQNIFKADLHIKEAQIIQESLNRVRVRYVPAPEFDQRTASLIKKRLRDRLGDVEVEMEAVTEIPRGPNGKVRAVVSKIDFTPAQRSLSSGN